MRTVCVLVVCAAAAIAVGVAPALADAGGNSEAALLCQQGGWQDLVREDQTRFENVGDCVDYAARGGTLVASVRPTFRAAQLLCESIGGVFATGSRGIAWTCTYVESNQNFLLLAAQCSADLGPLFGGFQIVSSKAACAPTPAFG
jgi:hypothetical protein